MISNNFNFYWGKTSTTYCIKKVLSLWFKWTTILSMVVFCKGQWNCSLRHRCTCNQTPGSDVCKAALRSLFWAPYGLSKLQEVCFKFPFDLEYWWGPRVRHYFNILCHGWTYPEFTFIWGTSCDIVVLYIFYTSPVAIDCVCFCRWNLHTSASRIQCSWCTSLRKQWTIWCVWSLANRKILHFGHIWIHGIR